MASVRKPHPKSQRGDGATYAEFMRDLVLTGEARALHEVVVPTGRTRPVEVTLEDADGVRVTATVHQPITQVASLEYEERPRPGGPPANQSGDTPLNERNRS